MDNIDKNFESDSWESSIYKKWEESGAFTPIIDHSKESYCVIMPPPNATGTLHLGHAVMLAIEDIFVRYKRMCGFSTLWLPGTDHAAIATQSRVESIIAGEGNNRHDMGREAFIERVKEYVADSQSTIRNQVRKMGSSCDWTREKYTMDDDVSQTVQEVFVSMFNDGLIYRGDRIVNWDPNMQTTVADDEVEYKEEVSKFYYFQFGPFVIGTARPETKFLDKIVIVHPDDERYKKWHNKSFEAEWINGPITGHVIADECADMEMGTGAMTITPCHSAVDFDLAEKYSLEKPQIIDKEGKLLDCAGEFSGMSIKEARAKIVEKLDKKGLLVKIEVDYTHNLATNYRGGGIIEPQIMKQWFIDVNKPVVDWKGKKSSLKQIALDVVGKGEIEIIPDRFNKIYFNWIENLRDWCISRQIWWGHRIPVFYRGEEVKAALNNPGPDWIQDPDTLDTWFSSGLWTFSTLGWPKPTEDFAYFHPTSILETGYDIIFFWVARMIIMTTYATKQVPFKAVYLHGLVRDKLGRKMSKSLGNGIDPLDMIKKYGADAVRLSLITGSTPGNDIRLYEEKIAGYRNFVNKIWNSGRFALMNLSETEIDLTLSPTNVSGIADKWILTRLNEVISDVTGSLDNHRISDAVVKIYDFLWSDFCDWYLEISKGDHKNPAVLVYVLKNVLRLLHPFVPFVTESLWSYLHAGKMLIEGEWPKVDQTFNFPNEANDMIMVIDVISSIRRLRADSKVEAAKKISAVIFSEAANILEKKRSVIERLARVNSLEISENGKKPVRSVSTVSGNAEIHLPLEDLINLESEKTRLQKEIANISGFINGLKTKLDNQKFIKNAPRDIISNERKKLAQAEQTLIKLNAQIAAL